MVQAARVRAGHCASRGSQPPAWRSGSSTSFIFNPGEGQSGEWVTEDWSQVWQWRGISEGLGILIPLQKKELPAVLTWRSSTLRGTAWPGVSTCLTRSTLEHLNPVPPLKPDLSASSYGKGDFPFLSLLHLAMWAKASMRVSVKIKLSPYMIWEAGTKERSLSLRYGKGINEQRTILCARFTDQNSTANLFFHDAKGIRGKRDIS